MDPSLLRSLAQQHVLHDTLSPSRLFDEERRNLENRAQQAEDEAKQLQERSKALEQSLEEAKKENAVLRAQLEFASVEKGEAGTVLGESYSAEAMKEINISLRLLSLLAGWSEVVDFIAAKQPLKH